jgi:hypothetical protein
LKQQAGLLATCFTLVSCLAYFSTLMMVATCSPKMSLDFSGLPSIVSQKIELFNTPHVQFPQKRYKLPVLTLTPYISATILALCSYRVLGSVLLLKCVSMKRLKSCVWNRIRMGGLMLHLSLQIIILPLYNTHFHFFCSLITLNISKTLTKAYNLFVFGNPGSLLKSVMEYLLLRTRGRK